MELDLDLDEFVPISEEQQCETCELCLHKNVFLTMQHTVLIQKCSKKNLYDLLYNIHRDRMKQLQTQNMKTVTLTRTCIETHFEHHSISYPRSLQEDARICKILQNELLQRMKHTDGSLEIGNITLWKSLSTYKLSLLKKLSTSHRTDNISVEPHRFD